MTKYTPYIPYVVILIFIVFTIFDFSKDRILKRNIKNEQKNVKVLKKIIKDQMQEIDLLEYKYNNLIIPNTDSLIKVIDEKNYIFVDSMSIDELKRYLTN
jgi:hypothetical protein